MNKKKENLDGWLKARCPKKMETDLEERAATRGRDASNLLRMIVKNWLKKNSK